jgi:DNA-binding MarR family transcriptional regulator
MKLQFRHQQFQSVVYEKRPEYYKAIEEARKANDSGAFIEFTLSAVLSTIAEQAEHQVKHQVKHQVDLTDTQLDVLKSLKETLRSRKEIFVAIGINGDSRSFKRHIEPLIEMSLIEMTVPDKPNSRLQKYRLTDSGKAQLKKHRQYRKR